ncbi:MAG: DUF1080 domain-containing protein, partial [Candidatus Hydrogenedentes bacterium]|nr:DUF1080 domain-containing protein [Candidatus Hydrogenedentota bacterium]
MRAFAILTSLMLVGTAYAELWNVITPPNDLSGWTVVSGDWAVEDGVVIGKGTADEPAVLLCDQTLIDFSMSAEFRTQDPATGGIYLRAHRLPALPLPDGIDAASAPRVLYGYRFAIDTTGTGAMGGLTDPHGVGPVFGAQSAAVDSVRADDWNAVTATMRENDISITVNDEIALTGSDTAYTKGALAL